MYNGERLLTIYKLIYLKIYKTMILNKAQFPHLFYLVKEDNLKICLN